MKVLFPAVFAAFFLAWVLWQASLRRLFRRLGARQAGHFPVWQQVKLRLDEIADRERFAAPSLWILSEFSPNALILRNRGRVHIALTEGLLRILEADELDAVLALCLAHGASRRRGLLTMLALQLFPWATMLQRYPVPMQVFFSPLLTVLLRLVSAPALVFQADRLGGQPFGIAAALQKMAVVGRKVPFRRWSFALDPLFLVSPLTLDGSPFWVFLSQPSVERRRHALLAKA